MLSTNTPSSVTSPSHSPRSHPLKESSGVVWDGGRFTLSRNVHSEQVLRPLPGALCKPPPVPRGGHLQLLVKALHEPAGASKLGLGRVSIWTGLGHLSCYPGKPVLSHAKHIPRLHSHQPSLQGGCHHPRIAQRMTVRQPDAKELPKATQGVGSKHPGQLEGCFTFVDLVSHLHNEGRYSASLITWKTAGPTLCAPFPQVL